mgnify:CR=1 FL=1
MLTGHPIETFDNITFIIQRCNHRQLIFLAQNKVFRTTARGNMHYPSSLGLAYFVPQDDLVSLGSALGNALCQVFQVSVPTHFLVGTASHLQRPMRMDKAKPAAINVMGRAIMWACKSA